MNAAEIKNALLSGSFDDTLKTIYGEKYLSRRNRIAEATDTFIRIYGNSDNTMIFSVPGRTEIAGNHTDHNSGKVVAASVDCDIIAIAAPNPGRIVKLKSEGYPLDAISLDSLKPGDYPYYKSSSLVCGMVASFRDAGYEIGGIDSFTTSNVLKGSGLSSSAAFEVMVGNMLNHIYNGGKVRNEEIAKMAQRSENEFFGKPCGLMDQMACAVGGFVNIDFSDPSDPVVNRMDFSLSDHGYELCIVNTGGSHSDLNDDYASIPGEMKAVARLFGKSRLRGITLEELLSKSSLIRKKCSDRALLRAMHFVSENRRVDSIAEAMKNGDINTFLEKIYESGLSSARFLQNVFSSSHPSEQGISLAIAVSEELFGKYTGDKRPVCRVHGGGFAGTMQAFVPSEFTDEYRNGIEKVFGKNSCMIMNVRRLGAIRIG